MTGKKTKRKISARKKLEIEWHNSYMKAEHEPNQLAANNNHYTHIYIKCQRLTRHQQMRELTQNTMQSSRKKRITITLKRNDKRFSMNNLS